MPYAWRGVGFWAAETGGKESSSEGVGQMATPTALKDLYFLITQLLQTKLIKPVFLIYATVAEVKYTYITLLMAFKRSEYPSCRFLFKAAWFVEPLLRIQINLAH